MTSGSRQTVHNLPLRHTEEGAFHPFFTILTRPPVGEAGRIHDRMPLILPETAIAGWIDPASPADTVKEISAAALTEMVLEKGQDHQ